MTQASSERAIASKWKKKLVVSFGSVALAVVLWRLGARWLVLLPIAAFAAYAIALPLFVRALLRRFHRESLLLLTAGNASKVPALAERSWPLARLGQRGPIEARLAVAYTQMGDFRRAVACFERAAIEVDPSEEVALALGHTKALFVIGDFAKAERMGHGVLDRGTRLPDLLVAVARSRIGLQKLDGETSALLDEAMKLSPSADVALAIDLSNIELAVARGKAASELRADAHSLQPYVIAWILLVRGLLQQQRGDKDAACACFREAVQADPLSFAAIEAQRRLEASEKSTEKPLAAEKKRTASKRRHRKRR